MHTFKYFLDGFGSRPTTNFVQGNIPYTCDFVKEPCSSNISAVCKQWKLKFQVSSSVQLFISLWIRRNVVRFLDSIAYTVCLEYWSQNMSSIFDGAVLVSFAGAHCVSKGISQNRGDIKISWLIIYQDVLH